MELNTNKRIGIVGSESMIGRRLIEKLVEYGYFSIYPVTSSDVLQCPGILQTFFPEALDMLFLVGGKSGGITANIKYPGDFIRDNILLQTTVIDFAHQTSVPHLLFLASSCVYPKVCQQPMKEEYLGSGRLEETSKAYAVSRIAGMTMCEAYNTQYSTNFISVIPATVYGPFDHFDEERSHVLSALICRFESAKRDGHHEVVLRGSGAASREFIFVDDVVDACILLMCNAVNVPHSTYNVGTGFEISIHNLANVIRTVTGFSGTIVWNDSLPDGPAQKLLDSSRMRALSWSSRVSLEEGIERTYRWFLYQQQRGAYKRP